MRSGSGRLWLAIRNGTRDLNPCAARHAGRVERGVQDPGEPGQGEGG